LPRSKYVTALDIGTTKICCVVGEPTDRGMNIVGVGEAPSEGLRRGVVVNMEKTVRGITHAVDAAQRMCGHKLESAYVGMAGTHVLSQNSRGVIARRPCRRARSASLCGLSPARAAGRAPT